VGRRRERKSAAHGYGHADFEHADFEHAYFESADKIATALDVKHLAELAARASCLQPVR
jgi:hypothetical protein